MLLLEALSYAFTSNKQELSRLRQILNAELNCAQNGKLALSVASIGGGPGSTSKILLR